MRGRAPDSGVPDRFGEVCLDASAGGGDFLFACWVGGDSGIGQDVIEATL
jgi:hypothetical protein